ncbi:hypothetical protein BT69DRAFT_1279762, partial [Atractiella rhizophila]
MSSPEAEEALSGLLERREPIILPAAETKQYDVMIESMRCYLDSGWHQVNTSAHIDTNIPEIFGATGVKPDIILYSPSRKVVEGRITDMKEADLFWEFKIGVLPFHDAPNEKGKGKENPDEVEIESNTLEARIRKDDDDDIPSGFENRADNALELRGQITLYNTVVQILQRRTRVFSIYICGETARLVCHSRTGTAVTLPFNYNKEPYLHQFLFQYTRATREPSDPVEEENARDRLGLGADDPLYVVKFGLASYYVSKPFTDFHMYPVGRSTKCFYAYCPRLKKLVLLKDIWRKMEYEKEGDTLRKLNVANVPNVPAILDDCDIEGDLQKIEEPYRQAMQHYAQVTDKIGRPLSSFTSSWEMVNARNILIYDPPSTSDRGSVESQGLLIDWEMAKVESSESFPRTTERTGTHQFIALELLSSGRAQHEPRHDLESFIYVLLWITIRHARSRMVEADRDNLLEHFDRKRTIARSHAAKKDLLKSPSQVLHLRLDTPELRNTLESVWRPFQAYMEAVELGMNREVDKIILTHSILIEKLVSALGNKNWKQTKDAAIEFMVRKRKRKDEDEDEGGEREGKGHGVEGDELMHE